MVIEILIIVDQLTEITDGLLKTIVTISMLE